MLSKRENEKKMELNEKTLEQNYLYRGKILDLHVDKAQLLDGRVVKRECVDHCGGVCIAALTAKNSLLLVKQYRYPYHAVLLEAPAGKLEPGEDPLEAGKRELREETGAVGENYVSLGQVYPSTGYTNEIIYLYACRVRSVGDTSPDDGEFLEAETIPLQKAEEMVMSGEIADAKTQIAVLKTAALVRQGKI